MTMEQEKQVSEVMELLSHYIATPPWEEAMVEVFSDAVAYVAEMLELTEDEVLDYLEEEPQGQMAHAHVFEHFITTETNEDGESVLQAFMRTRVQQDKKSYVCQYLEALSHSELALWEVVKTMGKQADVRRMGTTEPVIRVQMDVANVPANICIASRLLHVAGEPLFGFGMLPISRGEAEEILVYLDQVQAEMRETEIEQQANHDTADVEAAIREELVDLMFHETLTAWVAQGFEEE